jgi:uncharacterized delta-60 repeat protein
MKALPSKVAVACLAAWLMAHPVAPVLAATGELDLNFGGFGTGGRVVFEGAHSGGSRAMAVQPDGKIVTVDGSGGTAVELARYLPGGTIDSTFAGTGEVMFPVAGIFAMSDMALQPDGKIVACGTVNTPAGKHDFFVMRLTPDGALDPTFGTGGMITGDIKNGTEDLANALVVQPNGQIVVGGQTFIAYGEFAVARYNENGSLDSTFGDYGVYTIIFNNPASCQAMALQDDGKVVLVGNVSSSFNSKIDFAVARITPQGKVDFSFDVNGMLITDFGTEGHGSAVGVAIQSDGSIVVAGGDTKGALLAARYRPNGALDTSFDGDGKFVAARAAYHVTDLALQPDGKPVILGDQKPSNEFDFRVFRLFSNGGFDSGFGSNGQVGIDFAGNDYACNIALLSDGRIIAHGIANDPGIGTATALARLWPDGTLDVGGWQTLDPTDAFFDPKSEEEAFGMAIQADGKVVLAGNIARGSDHMGNNFALARFRPDGQPDLAFGSAGSLNFGFGARDIGRAVAIQPDGKIVVTGYTFTPNGSDFMVARFLPDGTADNTFGFGGFNALDFLGGDDYGVDIAIAPDGKIVVGGTTFNGARFVFGAARFNPNGTVDTAFDLDGKQLFEFVSGLTHQVEALLVQPDRRIILGGQVGSDFALVRFEENGAVDGSFGNGGSILTDMGGTDVLHDLAATSDGGLIAAGSREIGNVDFALARYTAAGALAPGFGSGGKAFADFGIEDIAYAVDVRSDSTIVAAGYSRTFALAQFRDDGTLDPAFNGTGMATTNFPGLDYARTVKFTGQGKIVLAGFTNLEGDYNMALAQFQTTGGRIRVRDPIRCHGRRAADSPVTRGDAGRLAQLAARPPRSLEPTPGARHPGGGEESPKRGLPSFVC